MAAEGWVAMSQRISAVLGQRSRKVGQVLGDRLYIDTLALAFVFRCDINFFIPVICGVE